MSIDPGSMKRPRCGWAVHYADPRITVTTWYVETPAHRYLMADLDGVLRVLTYPHPGPRIALLAGGTEVVVALPFALAYRSMAMVVLGLIVTAAVALGVLHDTWRHPRWLELTASHRGAEVVLFTTRDLDEFERVRWAVIRAMEANHGYLP